MDESGPREIVKISEEEFLVPQEFPDAVPPVETQENAADDDNIQQISNDEKAISEQVVETGDTEKLQKYLERIANKLPKRELLFSQRTVVLAKPKPRTLTDAHSSFKHVMDPLRAGRVKRRVDELHTMTTEEFAAILKADEKQKQKSKQLGKLRQKIFQDTLQTLEGQVREKAMSDIMFKFSEIVANRVLAMDTIPDIKTDEFQRLINCLMFNMQKSLSGQNYPMPEFYNDPVYKKIAYIAANFIVETLFFAQVSKDTSTLLDAAENDKKRSRTYQQMRKRARMASKKKLKKITTKSKDMISFDHKIKKI